MRGLGEAGPEDAHGDENRENLVREFVAKYAGARAEELNRFFDLDHALKQVAGNPLFFRFRLDDALDKLAGFRTPPESRIRLDSSPSSEATEANRIWDRFVLRRPDERKERSFMLELLCCCRPPGLSDRLLQALLMKGLNQDVTLAEVQRLLKEFSRYLLRSGELIHRSFLDHCCLAGHVCRTKLSLDELCHRHKLFVDVLREHPDLDLEYWAMHVIWHASQAGLDLASILTDGQLIRARLSRNLGSEHGGYLRTYLRGRDSERSPPAPQKSRHNQLSRRIASAEPVVRQILDECWKKDGEAFNGFSSEMREQATQMLVASRNRLLLEIAIVMYNRLYGMESHRDVKRDVDSGRDPQSYLLQKAWIAYQYLDDWELALETIKQLAERRDDPQWARAMRLKASIQFDQGSNKAGICTILQRDCLPCFERHGLRQDQGQTHEAIGIVLDAEGKWYEAMSSYGEAAHHYEACEDSLGLARLCMNRSIAMLFQRKDGLDAAWREIQRTADYLPLPPWHSVDQLEQYSNANQCLLALLRGDKAAYQDARRLVRAGETWLDLTIRTNDAVRTWLFDENHKAAESEMKALIEEFQDIKDAWGATDNKINLGFLYRDMRHIRKAAANFEIALQESKDLQYPVGASLASHGLSLLGKPNDGTEHQDFFLRYLEKLFQKTEFFSPCYLLLFP